MIRGMETVNTIHKLRSLIDEWRRQGERIAFVPTMGNLHAGHLQLVDVARQHGSRVLASIFVNPLQFVPGTDYENYPRTLVQDSEQLQAHGVTALFAPSVEEMYGQQGQSVTTVTVAGLSEILCGEFRPGHFAGVTTVVAKLFNLVQPQVAVFGEKDFQQLVVIRQMVRDLCFPVEIVGVPTVREDGGLAMSSRNQYLSSDERALASLLYQTSKHARQEVLEGGEPFSTIEARAMESLQRAGFRPEYVSIRQAPDLQPGQPDSTHLRVLAAAWLGQARLIDNLEIR